VYPAEGRKTEFVMFFSSAGYTMI